MKIGNIQFEKEAVSKMTVSNFVKIYKDRLKQDTENIYYLVTGKDKPTKKNDKKN